MKNTISVIIPTYQHEKTIVGSLESIFSQTRRVDEIIVVDDGSTDETKKVLEPYQDKVRYLYQKNQGAPAARNNGFKHSSGNMVIFWDADVIATQTMIEQLEEALEAHPEASWAYSSFWWGKRLFKGKSFDENALRVQNYIHTTSLIHRKDFPGFDESLRRFQDWDLWLTMSEEGKKGVFVSEALYTVLIDDTRPSYSRWLPKSVYKIPWKVIGWAPKAIRAHQEAHNVIRKKHNL